VLADRNASTRRLTGQADGGPYSPRREGHPHAERVSKSGSGRASKSKRCRKMKSGVLFLGRFYATGGGAASLS